LSHIDLTVPESTEQCMYIKFCEKMGKDGE